MTAFYYFHQSATTTLYMIKINSVVYMHEYYYARTIQMPPENHQVACIGGTLQRGPPFMVDFGGVPF